MHQRRKKVMKDGRDKINIYHTIFAGRFFLKTDRGDKKQRMKLKLFM